ncbi:MAG TPA: NIPSNAP family protein [Vicinamibacterales bacterium]|jgi:hypothetical protein|nr:NIPSNAP family protein [Vicinamibacterales bacterium]
MLRRIAIGAGLVGAFALGLFVGAGHRVQAAPAVAQAAADSHHVFEVRIYTAGPGKLDAVVKRFRDPEVGLFEKYGMKAIFYSTVSEPAERQNQFVYVLQHDSREAARKSWAGFLSDPAFRAAAQASDEGGRAVVKVESFFVTPTDFSPLK